MIAYLKGTLIQKTPDQVVIDTGGVGYGAAIPVSSFVRLGEIGATVELLVHTHLTDNALSLFGFASPRGEGHVPQAHRRSRGSGRSWP